MKKLIAYTLSALFVAPAGFMLANNTGSSSISNEYETSEYEAKKARNKEYSRESKENRQEHRAEQNSERAEYSAERGN